MSFLQEELSKDSRDAEAGKCVCVGPRRISYLVLRLKSLLVGLNFLQNLTRVYLAAGRTPAALAMTTYKGERDE